MRRAGSSTTAIANGPSWSTGTARRTKRGRTRSARLRNSRGETFAYAENACENDDRLL